MAPPKKTTKPTTLSSTLHPPYFQMISEAILTLKDRTGSSQQAISKFIQQKYNTLLPPNFKTLLSVQLKKFVKSERLVKVKNSYKISATEKAKLGTVVPIKQTPKKKAVKKVQLTSIASKGVRVSQVKTPEALKKVSMANKAKKGAKTKRLSQVKTPEGLKKKRVSTPMKRKNSKSLNSSRPASKKARN